MSPPKPALRANSLKDLRRLWELALAREPADARLENSPAFREAKTQRSARELSGAELNENI